MFKLYNTRLNKILGKHPSIFTGITYNVFDPPNGFCFDSLCGDKTPNQTIDGLEYINTFLMNKSSTIQENLLLT